MARRAFRPGAAAISQKRLTSWFQFLPASAALSVTGGTLMFSLNAAALALRPFTIVRTRFLVGIVSDQAAASEDYAAAFGMAVVSDEAVAVGVTAVPTPITQMASDFWFVHQMMFGSFLFGDVTGFNESVMTQYEIDSKAMRKVDIGQDLVVVAEFSTVGSGSIVTAGGRMLVKVN